MIKYLHKHITFTIFARSTSLFLILGLQFPPPQPLNAQILSLVLNYSLKQAFSYSTNKLIMNLFITKKSCVLISWYVKFKAMFTFKHSINSP